jgi:hypothetical protein
MRLLLKNSVAPEKRHTRGRGLHAKGIQGVNFLIFKPPFIIVISSIAEFNIDVERRYLAKQNEI